MDAQSILVIIVIVIIIFIIFWAFKRSGREFHDELHDRRRGKHGLDDDHPEIHIHHDGRKGCCKDKCCDGGDLCDAPHDLCCESNELFAVDVKWKASRCEVDYYNVYVKYLDHCRPRMSPRPNSGKRDEPLVEGRRRHRRGCGCDSCSGSASPHRSGCGCHQCRRHHGPDCGCDPCMRRRRKQPCGPHNFDKVIKVPGNQTKVKIHPVKTKGVCISVTAVNKCGKESPACESTKCCVECKAKVYPCIVESDCRGLTIKWNPIDCAIAYKIYYDEELLFELPGDAQGASGLPPIEESLPYGCENEPCPIPKVYVSVCTPCGEGDRVEVQSVCVE